MYFANRVTAGRWLAAALERYRAEYPIVLALPRGGVPVGYEVAHALAAPLDVLLVRKIGAPHNPEYAIGAVAPGVTVIDHDAVGMLGIEGRWLDHAVSRARTELERGLTRFRGDAPWPEVRGRTVIVVDDGIATGSTAQASVQALRQLGASRIVVAAPVCSQPASEQLRAVADDVVCLSRPADFRAVGMWYVDFTPTSDHEVVELLKQARLEWEARFEPAAAATE
jgi:putative phosphoribosyl transferase